MREIFFTLPEPTILLNQWQRMHWAKRHRYMKTLAWKIRDAVKPPRVPLQQCEIHIARYSTGTPDIDGLYGGVKGVLDCMVVCTARNPHGLGLIQDDSPEHILKLDVVPIKVKKRYEMRTEVTIRGE